MFRRQIRLIRRTAEGTPTALANLLDEFLAEHAEKKLAPKTAERHRVHAAYLSPELLTMTLPEIKHYRLRVKVMCS